MVGSPPTSRAAPARLGRTRASIESCRAADRHSGRSSLPGSTSSRARSASVKRPSAYNDSARASAVRRNSTVPARATGFGRGRRGVAVLIAVRSPSAVPSPSQVRMTGRVTSSGSSRPDAMSPRRPQSHARRRRCAGRSGTASTTAAARRAPVRVGRAGTFDPIELQVRSAAARSSSPAAQPTARAARARLLDVAAGKHLGRRVEDLVGAALPLGQRRPRAADVGARPGMRAIEKQHARPDMNGVVVIAGEVALETFDEQRLDAAVAVGGLGQRRRWGSSRLDHHEALRIIAGARPAVQARRRRSAPPSSDRVTSHMALIECVPNISEGRRADVVAEGAAAIRASRQRAARRESRRGAPPGRLHVRRRGRGRRIRRARAGRPRRPATSICASITACIRASAPSTSCRSCPLAGARMTDAVAIARRVGAEIARRFDLPVFLYGDAASTVPARRALEDVRRGEFEGLADKLLAPDVAPDFGPRRPHPSAGAVAVGRAADPDRVQREPGDAATSRLPGASPPPSASATAGCRPSKPWASSSRAARVAQVSMNLTNFEVTSPLRGVPRRRRARPRVNGVRHPRQRTRRPHAGRGACHPKARAALALR